jgi:hypothetical protein
LEALGEQAVFDADQSHCRHSDESVGGRYAVEGVEMCVTSVAFCSLGSLRSDLRHMLRHPLALKKKTKEEQGNRNESSGSSRSLHACCLEANQSGKGPRISI